MPGWSKVAAASFVAIILMFSLQSFADDDPPGRVARLSHLSGDVSMQPGGVDDWTTAKLNRPLTSGDRLWTAQDSRAEMHIGNAALRLDQETSFTLSNLDDNRVQVQVAQGSLNVRVRKLYDDETFEINTPNFTVNLLRAGDYRINVNNDADISVMIVRTGSAQVEGGGQSVTVHPRQQVTFRDSENPTYDVASAPGSDDFDEWCYARNRREDKALSAQYVGRDVIGYEDLDDYGAWRTYGSYGRVWVPVRVAPGWAPYRYGHWEWIYPWGWTWIDDAPWGFAPFHYGRWVHASFGWAWVPGPVYVRPVYAPALVAWIGGRSWGVGVSFGGGWGYGWLPLGPREPFIPWYRGSRHYWSRVNVRNTYISNTYITNVYNSYSSCRGNCSDRRGPHIRYANRVAPNGVTVVDRDTLVGSRHVGRNAMPVNPDAIRRAPVLANLDATPSRESVLGGRGAGRVNRPPERAFARPVVTRSAAPRPVPFERQVGLFNENRMKQGDLSPERRGIRDPRATGGVDVARPDRVEARDRVPRPPSAGGREGLSRAVEREGPDSRGMRPDRLERGLEPGAARREVPRPPERGTRMTMDNWGDSRPARTVPRPPQGDRPDRRTEAGPGPRSNREESFGSEARVPRPSVERPGQSRSPIDREARETSRSPLDREAREVPGPRATVPRAPESRQEDRGWRSPESRQEDRAWRAPEGNSGRDVGRGRQEVPIQRAPEMRERPSGNYGGGGRATPAPRGNSSHGGGGGERHRPGRGN
ncbi:MAG TPA: DUF6600 domain-containing protein [Terriglobales bacterium]|nr:DUF6600 domain-containing protein [Terriglobales bacterium]